MSYWTQRQEQYDAAANGVGVALTEAEHEVLDALRVRKATLNGRECFNGFI